MTTKEETTRPRAAVTQGKEAAAGDVMLVAYPSPAALRVPRSNEEVGRDWVAEAGLPRDGTISRKLLTFQRSGGRLLVTALIDEPGKTAYLDGAPLAAGKQEEVRTGAVLRLGETILVYRQSLEGNREPAEPLGAMVGPWGLRALERELRRLGTIKTLRLVLVTGETGTGKELLAECLAARLWHQPKLHVIDLPNIEQNALSTELFGHGREAYTGASSAYAGQILAARGGVVLIDEIGELPLDAQPKLLRFFETGMLHPLKGTPVKAEVKLICATLRDLDLMVEAGEFRQDLLARLVTHHLRLPPLRERREDIFAILASLAAREHLALTEIEPEAVERLLLDPLTHNTRTLIQLLERLRDGPRCPFTLTAVERVLGPLARGPGAPPPRASSGAERDPDEVSTMSGLLRKKQRRTEEEVETLQRFLTRQLEAGQTKSQLGLALGVGASVLTGVLKKKAVRRPSASKTKEG